VRFFEVPKFGDGSALKTAPYGLAQEKYHAVSAALGTRSSYSDHYSDSAVLALAIPSPTEELKMKSIAIVILGLFAISLTACNTVEGAGKDVKATGNAVENAAKDAKPK